MTTAFNPNMYMSSYQQPASYNAVKIDIHNPSVNAPQQQQQPVLYNYPTASIYPQAEATEQKIS